MSKMMKIELSMYGIAEVLHWCHDRNKGARPRGGHGRLREDEGALG